MNKVYIPQEPMKKGLDGRWISKGLNLVAATQYGQMEIIWGPDASILTRTANEREAMRVAEEFDEDEDYIVALGSPSLIALLCWAIGSAGKRIRMLEWDRGMGRYYPTLIGPTERTKA